MGFWRYVSFGAGEKLGEKGMGAALSITGIFLVAGTLRSGINEALEELGAPNDGVDFAEGILHYGVENVKDAYSGISFVLDKIKDNPDKHVQLNVDQQGNLKSMELASNKPEPIRTLS